MAGNTFFHHNMFNNFLCFLNTTYGSGFPRFLNIFAMSFKYFQFTYPKLFSNGHVSFS